MLPPPPALVFPVSMVTHHFACHIPASQPLPGTRSRPVPPSSGLVPAALPPPRASPEAASSSRPTDQPSHLFFSSDSRLLGETIPTPSTCTATSPSILCCSRSLGLHPRPGLRTHPHSQPPMPRSAFSVISLCHRFGKQERNQSFMGNSSNSWSHAPSPRLEWGLGSRPGAPPEPPTCALCPEQRREPPRDHGRCSQRRRGCPRKGLRGLEERMGRLLRRPPPAVQESCARPEPEPLLLVRVGAAGGPRLRMGAVNRCLKHPLARDTPVCLLAVLGAPRSGKTLLLDGLLRGLPGLEAGEGWPSGGGALPGCRWGADSLDRGVWMWSHPFLLGKEGREVAVFLVDTGDAMSPELSRETRTKLCALIMMLSSYQILNTSQELMDTDLEYLEMFVHVAEVMGRHYGMVPIQRLDLLVRDSLRPNQAGRGPAGDTLGPGKYPRVGALLRGRRARYCLLPALRRPWAGRDHGSPGSPEDEACPLRAYIADVLSAAPQHAKSRCQGDWSEGRPVARGDGRLLTGQQLAQEIKNLSGWMGRPGPGFASPDEMAAQLHDLRMVEAAKKEFKEYVRQQDVATKRIFSALRVLPDTMRSLLAAQKDAILARHGAALRCQGSAQALEALEAELQAQARAFMDTYTMRFCGHLAAVGGAVGAGLMGLAGGVVGAGMAAAALAAEAGMVAAGAAVGATGAAVVGGGVGAGLAATLGCMEKEEEERLQEGDREPLLRGE
uniref:RING finger protein 112 n=1 Tax=Myotis myotis TaxID=51298 RepID=A0A7J7RDM5_MYOMY|nr:ring finger protein 112 [Myotis myotis]